MKNSIKILAAIAILGFAGNASAQNTANASAAATANIVTPISVAKTGTATNAGNMSFGSFYQGAGPVIVSAAPSTTWTHVNNTAFTGTGALTASAANFTAGGEAGYSFNATASVGGGTFGGAGTGGTVPTVGTITQNWTNPLTFTGTNDFGPLCIGGSLSLDATSHGNWSNSDAVDINVIYN
jgi:hypothetical protein